MNLKVLIVSNKKIPYNGLGIFTQVDIENALRSFSNILDYDFLIIDILDENGYKIVKYAHQNNKKIITIIDDYYNDGYAKYIIEVSSSLLLMDNKLIEKYKPETIMKAMCADSDPIKVLNKLILTSSKDIFFNNYCDYISHSKIFDRISHGELLDLGCGYGLDSIFLSSTHDVTGVDINKFRLRYAKYINSLFNSDVEFYEEDAIKFLKSCRKFNNVWMRESISHIYDTSNLMSLVFKSLNDEGNLYILDSNIKDGDINPVIKKKISYGIEYLDEKEFNDEKLKNELLGIGFNQIKIEKYKSFILLIAKK